LISRRRRNLPRSNKHHQQPSILKKSQPSTTTTTLIKKIIKLELHFLQEQQIGGSSIIFTKIIASIAKFFEGKNTGSIFAFLLL
jgi:hypothetical protein